MQPAPTSGDRYKSGEGEGDDDYEYEDEEDSEKPVTVPQQKPPPAVGSEDNYSEAKEESDNYSENE